MSKSFLPSWAALTPLETERLAHNERLLHALLTKRGSLPFADYMEWALYHTDVGYYASREVFDAAGDYITAPLLSAHFATCLARQWAAVLPTNKGVIMEVGAGNGQLAIDTLKALDAQGAKPDHYWLIERAAKQRARAAERIAREIPQWMDRIHITDSWPDAKAHIIVANELLDALPAYPFRMRGGMALALHVALEKNRPRMVEGPPDFELTEALRDLALPDGYESETIPGQSNFLKEAAAHLAHGVILLIDYGFPRAEFYHPDRATGTIMCHFRHKAHPDPLLLPGLQDITAHVDFSALAFCAEELGLTVEGYTSQAAFLLSLGLGESMPDDERAAHAARSAIKRLTLPHEMGELFKVIAFGRNLEAPLQGFRLLDRRRGLWRKPSASEGT